MSLKPFKKNDQDYIRGICRELFTQWAPSIRHAEQVSVMLWTADGSEILELHRRPQGAPGMGHVLGNPNTDHPVGSEPDAPLSIHQRAFLYMENPPAYTLDDLRFIVQILKEEGQRTTGKPVRVAPRSIRVRSSPSRSSSTRRHPEICTSTTMGEKSFVCCYALLHQDATHYAGFPRGHPGGHAVRHFLGRQTQHFLTDLGFDYIWFSNGFGFGLETWSSTGAIFTGRTSPRNAVRHARRRFSTSGNCSARSVPRSASRRAARTSPPESIWPTTASTAGDLSGRLQPPAAAELTLGRAGRRLRPRADRLHVAHRRTARRRVPLPLLHARPVVDQQPLAGPLRPRTSRHLPAHGMRESTAMATSRCPRT